MDHNDPKPYVTSHQTATELGRDPAKDKRRFNPLLDRKSEPNPLLDALMDRALLQIVLTADGATSRLKADVVKGGSDAKGRAPVSSLAGEIDGLGRAFNSSCTHRARLSVIKEAQDTAIRLQYAPKCDPVKVKGTREWRESIANDERPRRAIALDHKISSKTITAIRREFGLGGLR